MDGHGYLINISEGYGNYVYKGWFKDGKRDGHGEWINGDKNKYVGQYYRDDMHGRGYYVDSNKNKYMG